MSKSGLILKIVGSTLAMMLSVFAYNTIQCSRNFNIDTTTKSGTDLDRAAAIRLQGAVGASVQAPTEDASSRSRPVIAGVRSSTVLRAASESDIEVSRTFVSIFDVVTPLKIWNW